MDTYYKIPKRLEEYRKRISFTQEQMGDIMGVGQDHYQRLEKGTVIISNNGLEKIEEHGGDIYYLITGEKQKTGIVNELLESCSNQKEKELLLRFYILCIEAELTKIQGEIKDEIHHYLRMSERALEEDTIWRGIRLLEGTTQMNMDEVRKTKHDMKNNMIYLQNLLKVNPEEAEKYLEKYIGDTTEKTEEFSKSGNLPVDAVLNYKNMIAKSKGINIILEQQIPIDLPYKDSDICIILGNLLDNAIEAVESSRNKEIRVYIMYFRHKFKIKVSNYYEGQLKKDGSGDYVTGKGDKINHGLGLKSVRTIVESYGGLMEISSEDFIFQVSILI